MSYLSRTLEPPFLEASGQIPVLLLTGPRQIGKTTFLRHLAGSDRTYVTLDDPLVRELASSDPALFLQRFQPPLLIDEIHYAPQLLPLMKAPKLYLLDTGLAAYLTEWSSPQSLEAGAMNGAFLETWAVTEILKSYWHNGRRASLCFYRDRDQKEIDLLIHRDDTLYPIEIKKTARPTREAVRHFQVLGNLGPAGPRMGPGALVCLADMRLPIAGNISTVPFASL